MTMINRFLKLANGAQKIVISTHIYPDADGIGSEIALCVALRRIGKEAVCVNEEPLLERYKYLDPENTVISYKEYKERGDYKDIDLFIVVDTNSLPRIGSKVQALVTHAEELLFIDHHPCPREMARIHCIDTSTAATGELMGHLIESLGVTLSKEIALPLYTSILIDTSSFRYPTVSSGTHRMIAKLMEAGVDPPEAYNSIYGTKQVSYLKLLGTVLRSAQITQDGSLGWIVLMEEDLDDYNVDPEDTHGFINHLLILDKIQVAVMFRQTGNSMKVSLRSVDNKTDVGVMAQALGGGGHNHSAATVLEGQPQKVINETIKKIQLMISEDDHEGP